jgi:hypothetical protein
VADRHRLPNEVIANLPPGSYTLNVGLYNLDTGERLAVWAGDVPQGDQIGLGPVRVP